MQFNAGYKVQLMDMLLMTPKNDKYRNYAKTDEIKVNYTVF